MDGQDVPITMLNCPNCRQSSLSFIRLKNHSELPVSLLDSNQPPDSIVESAIQESLMGAEKEMNDVNEEIRCLEEAISMLKTRHKNMKMYIQRHRSVVSVVRRLPAEILGEIFLAYMHNSMRIDLCQRSLEINPWLLGWVCRSWRTVSHSMPTLWSKFIFNELRSNVVAHQRLQSCLSISHSSPLSFTVVCRSETPLTAWKMLITECHRWEHLEVLDDHKIFAHPINAIDIKDNIPMLRSLRYFLWNSQPCGVVDVFENSPLLREVSIGVFQDVKLTLGLFRMPWSQLTHLTLYQFTFAYGELSTLLSQLYCLTKLSWENCFSPMEDLEPINLPRLHSLECRGQISFDSECPYQIFTLITAPNLKVLKLALVYHHSGHQFDYHTDRIVDFIEAFQARSRCMLTKFFIGTCLLDLGIRLVDKITTKTLIIDGFNPDGKKLILDHLFSNRRSKNWSILQELRIRLDPNLLDEDPQWDIHWLINQLKTVSCVIATRIVVEVREIAETVRQEVDQYNGENGHGSANRLDIDML